MSLAHDGTILLTGAAGFIGYHLADRLLARRLPRGRRRQPERLLRPAPEAGPPRAAARAARASPSSSSTSPTATATPALFARCQPAAVVHLAAQAGVRYSLENPHAYVDANLVGFINVLEGCRHQRCDIWSMPRPARSTAPTPRCRSRSTTMSTIRVSLYAATKKANELMAHTYSHLYRLPTTGLRFFTVYGPWGRPDMALFIFTKAMLRGPPDPVFNEGRMQRDFTYIDDIVEGVRRVIDVRPRARSGLVAATHPDPGTSRAPYRLYNIGNHSPVELLHMIATWSGRSGSRRSRSCCRCSRATSGDLRRHRGSDPGHRLHPGDPDRGRYRAASSLVPRRVAAARRRAVAAANAGRRSAAANARRSICGTRRCSAPGPPPSRSRSASASPSRSRPPRAGPAGRHPRSDRRTHARVRARSGRCPRRPGR